MKIIILIDEYDVPLDKALQQGYWLLQVDGCTCPKAVQAEFEVE